MTDSAPDIGMRFGAFTILSVDPLGRRCVVSCACLGTHIFSCESLLNGSASCIAMPISSERAASMRFEREELGRQRDQKRWRPGST